MAILEDHTAKCSESTLPSFNHARSILLDIPGVHENIYKTYILYTLGGHGFLALYLPSKMVDFEFTIGISSKEKILHRVQS